MSIGEFDLCSREIAAAEKNIKEHRFVLANLKLSAIGPLIETAQEDRYKRCILVRFQNARRTVKCFL